MLTLNVLPIVWDLSCRRGGSVEFGKRTGLVLNDVASYKDIVYHYGVNHVERVWVAPLR
jgi:hypothetical protein